ncbi:MAG: DUF1425 domain-containing protein [Burkholderiales bacterium]
MKPIIVCVIPLVALLGCASKGEAPVEKAPTAFGCPVASSKHGALEDLIKAKVEIAGALPGVTVNALTCTMRNDALRIDVELANKAGEVRRVAYKFRWLDRSGLGAWDDESLKPVMLYPHATYNLTGLAPTSNAVDFRLFLIAQDQ